MENIDNRNLNHTKRVLERVIYAENQLRKRTSLVNDITGEDRVLPVLIALIEDGAFNH